MCENTNLSKTNYNIIDDAITEYISQLNKNKSSTNEKSKQSFIKNIISKITESIKLKRSETKDWIEEGWLLNQGYTAYHVVDGQQRLTTFVILVNSIIDFAKANGIEYIMGKTIEDIESRYIIEYKKPEKILKAYKFGYTVDNPSFEYLRYKIFGEKNSGTITETFYTRNLERAKSFFDEKLKE